MLLLVTTTGVGVYLAACMVLMAAYAVLLQPLLHVLQLEGYKNSRFLPYCFQNGHKMMPSLLAACLSMAGWYLFTYYPDERLDFAPTVGICLTMGFFACVYYYIICKKTAKKPLVFTARVKRLIFTALLGPVCFLLAVALFNMNSVFQILLVLFILWPQLWLALANFINAPLEKFIIKQYKKKAIQKLSGIPNCKVIGITGSYGKTSAKFILKTILDQKFRTLATPQSYNTPMGVCRAIGEQLDDAHEVFICEMGARHTGDIQEICDMVHPSYGLLTAIGPQHLETFGDIQTVAKTKNELMLALPDNGMAIFPADHEYAEALFTEHQGDKKLYGLDRTDCFASACDIQTTPQGSTFTLVIGENRKEAKTVLLGRHNIHNIVGAAALAACMGLSMEEIVCGIDQIAPIEHRMQIVRNDGITVIDDAFNASPHGTKAALDVLAGFEGRKIVVTPGLVELGSYEIEENNRLGQQAAKVAQVLLVVGKGPRAEALKQGWQEGGCPQDAVACDDLNQATAWIAENGQTGDVILFENDLPDHM